MIVRPYQDEDFAAFSRLVIRYFQEDLQIGWTEAQLQRLAVKMQGLNGTGRHWILVLENEEEGTLEGFLEYQIDGPDLGWNYRPGDGFIRESYVVPEYRRQGFARKMAKAAEQGFLQAGVSQVYLTCDNACHIWERLGYEDTGELCSINGGKVYTKDAARY